MFDPSDFEDDDPISSQLIRAVTSQNMELLQSLITPRTPLQDIQDSNRDTLIHFAIRYENLNILEYLLNLNRIKIDSFNNLGKTPLLMASIVVNPRFVELLLEHGANPDLSDSENNTPLHYATYYNFFQNSTILLEHGADVNAQNNRGLTVLHLVCARRHDIEWVAMLLFYGADATVPAWEPRNIGYTPFELALFHNKKEFQEVLFDHVFDGVAKAPIALGALVAAMEFGCELFPRILENVDEVILDHIEIDVFIRKIFYFNSDYLRLFIEKFRFVVTTVSYRCYILYVMRIFIVQHSSRFLQSYQRLIDNFYILFNAPMLPYFVDNINRAPKPGYLSSLIKSYHMRKLPFDQLSEMIYHLLSYGVDLRDEDIDNIYSCFGDNKLFRSLLHMDIINTDYPEKPPLPTIIHDITASVSTFITEGVTSYDVNILEKVMDYFTDIRLKALCSHTNDNVLISKSQKIPNVPSLLQLARDASRNFIVRASNVNNSRQFYTVLKTMPIPNVCKAIIAFERKLYC